MTWLGTLRSYFLWLAIGNLLWETIHVPLYTIWNEKNLANIAFAVIHCTGGDLLIGASALFGALLVFGQSGWPEDQYKTVAALTVTTGVLYTAFSEWFNTTVRESWSYADAMPIIPGIGLGLSPIAQWVVIPSGIFLWLYKRKCNFPNDITIDTALTNPKEK